MTLIQQGAKMGAAKLWYDTPKKQSYLLVSLEVEVADPMSEQHTQIIGVDVGIRYLAVTSTTQGKAHKIFRLCLNAILSGAALAEEDKLSSLFVHNQERLERICRLLG